MAGGGAIEMELSRCLREASRAIYGKGQLLVGAYAKALEIIPRQVAENAGLDATDILNKLRQKHAQGATWYGVDVNEGDVCDTNKAFVWEVRVRTAATAAAAKLAARPLQTARPLTRLRTAHRAAPLRSAGDGDEA